MTSFGQQIELSQVGLYPIDTLDRIRLFPARSAGDHYSPVFSIVRDDSDRGMRCGDRIVFSELIDDDVDELVGSKAFSSHGRFIAETAGLAKYGNRNVA